MLSSEPAPQPDNVCQAVCVDLVACIDGFSMQECLGNCQRVQAENPDEIPVVRTCIDLYLANDACDLESYGACVEAALGDGE